LLLDLEEEGAVVLTCHHVIAPVKLADLRVMIPQPDGKLGEPMAVSYEEELSRPEMDAVVLRVNGVRLDERPLLHKLSLDTYNGSLEATGLTYLQPDSFQATVRASTRLDVPAERSVDHRLTSPQRYELRAFLLSNPDDARRGISGGVALCEDGVLGLVHFGRAEGPTYARQAYLVPLTTWAEGWPALLKLIEPLIDRNLRAAAKVKIARDLEVRTDVVMASYRSDIYLERDVDRYAHTALTDHRGVIIVGRPESGKTRLAWQLLQKRPEALVIIPHPDSSRPPDRFEGAGLANNDLVVFLDDLHLVAQTANPLEWRKRLEDTSERGCLLICTSRDGRDWDLVNDKQRRLLDEFGPDAIVYTSRVGEPDEEAGEDFPEQQGKQLASALGISTQEFGERFDGTPGSLLLDLGEMRRRYEVLRDEQRGYVSMSRLLDSAKLLHEAWQPNLPAKTLRAVAEEIRGDGRVGSETWDILQRRTLKEGFGQFDDTGNFQTYWPYLERCVSYEPSEEEIEQLQPILARDGDVTGLLYLANRLVELRDYEQAWACYEQATKLEPDYPEAWFNKGVTLRELGRPDEALDAFEQAIRGRPNYPKSWYIRLRPDYSRAYLNKGWSLYDLGRYGEALDAFEQAIRLRPNYAEAWYRKGLTLISLDQKDEAVEWLCRAWRAYEQFPKERAQVAEALAQLGHNTKECESEHRKGSFRKLLRG
jgi:tetratricopeptide (TPR) repeat protein